MTKVCQTMSDTTAATLSERLSDLNDQGSWREFHNRYWRAIYSTALRSGLDAFEAEDVVQETVVSIFRRIESFDYDPRISSFKEWLLTLTRWRIVDQLRKRRSRSESFLNSDASGFNFVVIASEAEFARIWNEEWRANAVQTALDRVKRRVEPSTFQMFELITADGWSAMKVAKTCRVNLARVYVIKHRLKKLLKAELKRL